MSNEQQERVKKIVSLRNQGYTFEAIARMFKITRQRVHQLYKAGIKSEL